MLTDMEHMFDSGVLPEVLHLLPRVLAQLEDPGGITGAGPADLAAMLLELERAHRHLEGAVAQVVREADRSGAWHNDGHRGVTAWQKAVVNCSHSLAQARTRTARLIANAPEVGKRMRAGSVGVDQVRLMARVAANPRCGDRLVDEHQGWIPWLLDQAEQLTMAEFQLVMDRWEQLADTDGAGTDRALRQRSVQLSVVGDIAVLKGSFDAATGVALRAILAVFEQAEFHKDREVCEREGFMPRTASQRRADALVAVFHQSIGGGEHLDVEVNFVVDVNNFERMLKAEPLDPGPNSRCETLDGHVVPPSVIVAAAVVGRVRAVIMDRRGVVVALGRRQRLFTRALRTAIHLQGVRCVWPGCRTSHPQLDHMVGWSDGGGTDPHNMAPLCGWHNRWKFRHGYQVQRLDSGSYRILRADGSIVSQAG